MDVERGRLVRSDDSCFSRSGGKFDIVVFKMWARVDFLKFGDDMGFSSVKFLAVKTSENTRGIRH